MISCKVSTFRFTSTLRERRTAKATTLNPKPTKFVSFGCCACPSASAGVISAGEGVGNEPKRKLVPDEEEEIAVDEGRKVHCEVEVVSWRERRIKGQVTVRADVLSVWNVITDYERLADFIPNLVSSGRIPCPHPGRIWLEQKGVQRSMYWHIEARVVLDLQEVISSADNRELQFCMVDGDFKKFDGKWTVKPGTSHGTTILSYEVNVLPRFNFPAIFLERIIASDLPVNLQAVACQAERDFADNRKTGVGENELSIDMLSSHGVNAFLNQKDKISTEDTKQTSTGASFGHGPSHAKELNSNWGVFGKVCNLERPSMVDEVHLRRFDGLLENGGVHRCVIASITVKASVREVWTVLTAYESLPEIVPNLAISKIVSRENNKVRILQEGCKGLLYMVLHARVVLDLCERHQQEISFQQVEGDFDSFQGKWSLEQLGTHHTLLKYSVESKMHKNSLLSEAIMEEVVYEDLPSNLCAIRDYIETRESTRTSEAFSQAFLDAVDSDTEDHDNNHKATAEQVNGSSNLKSSNRRPKVPGLQKDFEVLKSELQKFISAHGQEGFMPMRKQLRLHGRVDIEKAINHMGGFRRIATLMSLSLAYKHRKPKGHWDKLENLQEEINRFQRSWGMDPSFMPSRKAFERAGRYDIARALEKWGGLHEVSRLLSLKVRYPNRQQQQQQQQTNLLLKDKKTTHHRLATPTNTTHEGDKKVALKNSLSQDAGKWVLKLRDSDINWVEY